ncbi:acylneuraminate cytidylyltransferase [Candidatus Nitrosopumilus sp. SW]|uniref:cytidylyltransferase domain-containing protein n=1 Tax=Candidatus Nitrosopumilus sp. SW TaxID=2508726 RepID=UPI001151121C|nr:acylneuraminate cytidylyltransferase [Candidatus Nitrosopumilus sp. SW]QDI88779.1 acylneuraminate cytidylyltransferase [Candidatus Nitrosopumilus sp. SW]
MNYGIFLLVRLDSSRLPKKAMKLIDNQPIIQYLLNRLQKSTKTQNLVVCTTEKKSDDPLVSFLDEKNIKYFRGSEHDILIRLRDAAIFFETDFAVVVDGDDIYTDPHFVDKVIEEFEKTNADFITDTGFPHGFIPVGVARDALEKICRIKISKNTETGYREFFTKTNIFNCRYLQPDKNLVFNKKLRLTLDYEEDYELAKRIFGYLGNDFHLNDILILFEKHPDLIKIIDGVDERWKKNFGAKMTDLTLKQTGVQK